MKRAFGFFVAALLPSLVIVGCSGQAPTRPGSPLAPVSAASEPAAAMPAVVPWSCLTSTVTQPMGIFASAAVDASCVSSARVLVGPAAATAPGAPPNLTASVNGGTVTLTWLVPASPDPAMSYVIEAGTSAGSTDIAVFDTLSTATSFTATGVPAGTYFVRVRARNSAGTSAASNEVVVIVGGGACSTAPGAPSGLNASVSGSSVTLSWTAPGSGCAPTGYVIEAGSSTGSSNLANFNTGSTATTFSDGGVPNGTYFVRVRAANGIGQSGPSNEITVVVGGSPPGISGRWVGLVANGDGLSAANTEKWDLQFDLNQSGTMVTGTYTQTGVIVEQGGGVRACAPNCPVNTVPITGTADAGTLSFTATTNRGSLILTGSYTASRMTGSMRTTFNGDTGTFALNKQ